MLPDGVIERLDAVLGTGHARLKRRDAGCKRLNLTLQVGKRLNLTLQVGKPCGRVVYGVVPGQGQAVARTPPLDHAGDMEGVFTEISSVGVWHHEAGEIAHLGLVCLGNGGVGVGERLVGRKGRGVYRRGTVVEVHGAQGAQHGIGVRAQAREPMDLSLVGKRLAEGLGDGKTRGEGRAVPVAALPGPRRVCRGRRVGVGHGDSLHWLIVTGEYRINNENKFASIKISYVELNNNITI